MPHNTSRLEAVATIGIDIGKNTSGALWQVLARRFQRRIGALRSISQDRHHGILWTVRELTGGEDGQWGRGLSRGARFVCKRPGNIPAGGESRYCHNGAKVCFGSGSGHRPPNAEHCRI
jgi:hypothetical protein